MALNRNAHVAMGKRGKKILHNLKGKKRRHPERAVHVSDDRILRRADVDMGWLSIKAG